MRKKQLAAILPIILLFFACGSTGSEPLPISTPADTAANASIWETAAQPDTYSIFTIQDDALFCLADALGMVELTYFERTGILCQFARWNGGDEGGYGKYYYQTANDRTLTDNDPPLLHYVYNAIYDEENEYTDEGITEYFYLGEETDEASYEKRLGSLGILQNSEKVCSENALEKEEMLALLSAL